MPKRYQSNLTILLESIKNCYGLNNYYIMILSYRNKIDRTVLYLSFLTFFLQDTTLYPSKSLVPLIEYRYHGRHVPIEQPFLSKFVPSFMEAPGAHKPSFSKLIPLDAKIGHNKPFCSSEQRRHQNKCVCLWKTKCVSEHTNGQKSPKITWWLILVFFLTRGEEEGARAYDPVQMTPL